MFWIPRRTSENESSGWGNRSSEKEANVAVLQNNRWNEILRQNDFGRGQGLSERFVLRMFKKNSPRRVSVLQDKVLNA
jgi:chorismate mutase